MTVENPALVPSYGGQIVRVYLENFMTHNSVEIKPGFHLNMIIGPNGTGKSTIVSAVLLGLGGKLKTLGRADHLSSYVKSGCDQSLIEIELFNPKGKNIVIKRIISSSNQSQFYINDVPAKVAQIYEIRTKFNIQVDNLCTFLPQEKVQDFAKMNPQSLLENTESTIGHGELLEQHAKLKASRGNFLQMEGTKEKQQAELNTLVAKNERLLPKVEAIKEKQAHCDKVTLLNQKKHWLIYHEAVENKKKVEKDLKLAKDKIETKKKEVNKAQDEMKKIEDNSKSQQEACIAAKREENAKKGAVEDRLERLNQKMDRTSHLDNLLSSRLNEESKKKSEVDSCQTVVDKLTNDLHSLDQSYNVDTELKQEDLKLQRELEKKRSEEMGLSKTQGDTEESTRSLQHELRNVIAEKRLLENRRSHRLEYLRNHEKDVYESVMWLEQNQHLFHGKVYNPMLLELDVTNPKMAAVVETTIPYSDLIAFSVTYNEDLNTLVENLRVKMRLKVNIVTAELDKSTQYSPNIPISHLKNLGFVSYVKEFITGPEPILQYLCRNYRIHNIPVGDARVASAASSIPNSIRKYFSDEHVFTITISSYSREKGTSVRKLNEARFFTESIDVHKISALDKKANTIRQKLENIQQTLQNLTLAQEQLKKSADLIRCRRREIATRLEERNQIVFELSRVRSKLDNLKKTLKDPAVIREEINQEKRNLLSTIDRALDEVHKSHEALQEAFQKRCKTSLLLKTCRAGITDVQERLAASKEALAKFLDAVRLVENRFREAEADCSRARARARELTEGYGPGDSNFREYAKKFETLSDSMAELEAQLAESQARADFFDGGTAQVLTEYSNRELEIAQMKTTLDSIGKKREEILKEIDMHRDEWLDPVQDLVKNIDESFGKYFAKMGCAGEVSLLVPEDANDFEMYGIRIRVKFRDNIPLQDLGRNFQSGGERAVSTAIYMISLQNLTNVPFRFVDEINQGMDPVNEKRITDLIIRVTTPVDSSQYFFITPKLIPEVDCPDTMAVLCVYNGPFAMPSSEWDVEKFERIIKGIQDDDDEC